MKTRAVADRRAGALQGVDALEPNDLDAAAAWVGRALDEGVDTAVVVGDDATLGAVLSGYLELHRRRPEPMVFALVNAGPVDTVARAIEAEAFGRSLPRVERKLSTYRTQLVPTLRVVDSSTPVARLGFGFGMGAVVDLLGDGGMRRRDTLRQSLRKGGLVEAELTIDWEHRADGFGYLLASAMPRSWGKVDMGPDVSVRLGSSVLDLLRGATRVGRAAERALAGGAKRFDRIHIVTSSDYVLDGLVVRSATSRVVRVEPGPRVRLLVPGR